MMKTCLRTYVIALAFTVLTVSQVAAAPVKLNVWAPWVSGNLTGDIFYNLVDEFNANQSDVKVEVSVPSGNFLNQLLVAYAGNSAPDVIVGGTGGFAIDRGGVDGVFLPLDNFIDGPKGFKRNDFVDLWSFSMVYGKTYQLAMDSNERALYVNSRQAEEVGLDTKKQHLAIRDWAQLLDWAKKLTVRQGDKVTRWGFNANHNFGGDRFHWIWLNDGRLLSPDGKQAQLNHPNTIEAAQFAADMVLVHQVAPAPGAVSGSGGANFIKGTYSMFIGQSIYITDMEKSGITDYFTVPGPPGIGKQGGRISGATSSTVSIINTTKVPDAAWTFVRWLVYEHGLDFATARNGVPYLRRGLQDKKFTKQPWLAFAMSMLTYKPEADIIKGLGSRHYTLMQAAWNATLKGEQSAKAAFDTANASLQAALDEVSSK